MLFEISAFRMAGETDWLPAVVRAQQILLATPTRGFTLLFEPTDYDFSDSIPIIRGMSIVGSGGSFYSSGTVFRFPAGKHGIVVHSVASAPLATPGDGFGSIIERVCIQGTRAAGDLPDAHGVVMNARAVLRDVYVDGFAGDGIHIEASLPQQNASVWQIQNCTVANCGRHGLHVTGSDVSAGCAIGLDLRNNLGWGVLDESFLGNSYVACVAHNNAVGSYSAPTLNGSTMFLNCYAEGDQPRAQVSPVHFVLGSIFDTDLVPGQTFGPAMMSAEGGAGMTFPNGARAHGRAFPMPEHTIGHWRLPTVANGRTWVNPAAVGLEDRAVSTHSLFGGQSTSELKVTGFGFSLPPSARISGIEVQVSRRASKNDLAVDRIAARDASIRLLKAGAPAGISLATPGVWPKVELTWTNYGGGAGDPKDDLWTEKWSAADVNDPGFGVAIVVRADGDPGESIDLEVDFVRMFVWYVISPDGRVRVSTSIGSTEEANIALSLERYEFNNRQLASAPPYRLAYGATPGSGGPANGPDPNRDQSLGWWDMNFGANPIQSPFRFSTEEAPPRFGSAQFWMPRGFFIGNPQQGAIPIVRVVAGNGVPVSGPESGGQWAKGDRVLNAMPDPDDPDLCWAGWICIVDPKGEIQGDVVGQWRAFGRIS
jgi:hypothetical protein